MAARVLAIHLTDHEQALLAHINLEYDSHNGADGHAIYLANQEPIIALLTSLFERKGIPEHRMRYWKDPACRAGRLKGSRLDLYRRNGNQGWEPYTHPNFVPELRYFVFGSELPESVIAEFRERIGDPRWVSSSDVVPLAAFARQLTRKYRLDLGSADEEFFKLSLDLGLSLSVTQAIQRSVKQVRYR